MELSKARQFFVTMIPFAVLGAAFKVMVLVEGITEVRPANAIPMISGLAFGPIGALGCAVGNLIADCFGTLDWTSALGFAGNFMAAYLPYRLWHLLSREQPNVHTYKNIALYVFLSLLSAQTVAMILGFGLELFFGVWIDSIYIYVLWNNFGFSLALGLPLFIVFTSDSVRLAMRAPAGRKRTPGGDITREEKADHCRGRLLRRVAALGVTGVYTAGMAAVTVGVLLGRHLGNSMWIKWLTAGCMALLFTLCVMPPDTETFLFSEQSERNDNENASPK